MCVRYLDLVEHGSWCLFVLMIAMKLILMVMYMFLHFFPFQALDMIRGKNILLLMDSHLDGNFSTEEANVVFDLASQCLQYEPRERPTTKDLVSTLTPLQNKSNVSPNLFFLYSLPLEMTKAFISWIYFLSWSQKCQFLCIIPTLKLYIFFLIALLLNMFPRIKFWIPGSI